MPYYLVRPDVEHHAMLSNHEDWVQERLLFGDFRGLQQIKLQWEPFEVKVVGEEALEDFREETPLGDMMSFGGSGIPIVSERAKNSLSTMFEKAGELLPVFGGEKNFYVYHVTLALDALDKERSAIKYFSDGGVMHVDRYVLKLDTIKSHDIFRISDLIAPVFVSHRFVEEVQRHNLTGFKFTPVETFPNEPSTS